MRQALALGVNRQAISENFYFGPPGEPPASNILLGIPGATSPNTTWEFDLDKATPCSTRPAGCWTATCGRRTASPLNLTYRHDVVNEVRQKTQAVIKSDWEKMGFQVELLQIDAGVFFDTSAGNDQNFYHMYWDVQ